MHKIVPTHLMFISSPVLHLTVLSLRGCSCMAHFLSHDTRRKKKNNDGNLSEGFAVKHGRQTDTEVNLEKALTFPAWLECTEQQRDELLTDTDTHTPLRRFSERLSRHTHTHRHT